MKRLHTSGKGQISLEAGILMLFILIVLISVWLGGPIQQSTEKSTDTNDLVLAAQLLDAIASNAEIAAMSGIGGKRDFVVHIPFNTVDMVYGESIGPHVNISILLYNNLTRQTGEGFSMYSINSTGFPLWYTPLNYNPGAEPPNTPFLYATITKELKFPLEYFPFCDVRARKDSTEIRGPSTQLLDVTGQPIKFCGEAGFNIHVYAEKSPSNFGAVRIIPRRYYSLPDDWR